jgi:hypothetical protein
MQRYTGFSNFLLLLLLGCNSPNLIPVPAAAPTSPAVTPNASIEIKIGGDPSDPDLGIYNLTDQDLSPALRSCLTKNPLGKCLAAQLKKGPVHVPSQNGDSSSEQLEQGWKDFLHSAIGASKIFDSYSPGFAFGFAYGMSRVDPEQVLMDPNMRATTTALGDQAVWVVHTLELAPGVNDGTLAAPLEANIPSKSYYGGIFQAGGIVRLTKRHPLDQVYTKNFWGDLGEDKQIVEQSIPDYIKVPTELEGSGLLAGEGIQFEAFMLVEIGVGPTYNLGVTPATPFLGAGLFGSAGFVGTVMRGHFNTKMEVQNDRTLRVTLERINQDSEKLDAQLNAGFIVGPFSIVKNLLNLEVGVTHTKETLFDMTFDPTYPEAAHALKEAYFGRFTEAQKLAADQSYKGVKEIAHSTMKETSADRDFSFLAWGKGSSESQSQIDTQFDRPDASNNEGADDKTSIDEEDSHSSSFGKTMDLQIAMRNDSDPDHTGLGRSLSVKYNFKVSKASQNDVQQFIDIATLFGQAPSQAPEAGKPLQGYFFMDLDGENMNAILSHPDSQIAQDFEDAASLMPGAQDHMKEIKTFAKALAKALKTSDPDSQDHLLMNSLRGKGFDLYAIGVLSLLANPSHTLALERVTFDNANTLEFPAIGSLYSFPSRIEY